MDKTAAEYVRIEPTYFSNFNNTIRQQPGLHYKYYSCGARNLKLGGNGEQGPRHREAIIFWHVDQMSTLFSCCAHRKDVAGPGTESLVN